VSFKNPQFDVHGMLERPEAAKCSNAATCRLKSCRRLKGVSGRYVGGVRRAISCVYFLSFTFNIHILSDSRR